VVDQDGLPLRLLLTAGQTNDKIMVQDLLRGLPPAKALVADRGYDSRLVVQFVKEQGGCAHIPTQRQVKQQRTVDPALYRQRNHVERFSVISSSQACGHPLDKVARN
jgi:transposase